jgi:invasion protein IalB
MTGRLQTLAASCVALALTALPAIAQAPQLPNGASSLNETYGDWRVSCVVAEAGKRCAMSQTQAQANGQRILAVELSAPSDNAVEGVLVLPFGLSLAAGVVLMADDSPPGPALPFRTCLPGGCLVELRFDASMLVALRAGMSLAVTATADTGGEVSMAIPLGGFAAALDRTAELSR